MTDQPPGDTAVASANLARMRLTTEPRLRRLAALGASGEPAVGVRLWSRILDVTEWKDLGKLIGLSVLVTAALAVLMAITVVSASLILMGLWYVLRRISKLVS